MQSHPNFMARFGNEGGPQLKDAHSFMKIEGGSQLNSGRFNNNRGGFARDQEDLASHFDDIKYKIN